MHNCPQGEKDQIQDEDNNRGIYMDSNDGKGEYDANGINSKTRQKRVEKSLERVKMEQFMSKFERSPAKKDCKKKKNGTGSGEESPTQSPQSASLQPSQPSKIKNTMFHSKFPLNKYNSSHTNNQKNNQNTNNHKINNNNSIHNTHNRYSQHSHLPTQHIQQLQQFNKYSSPITIVSSTSTSTTPSISLSSSPTQSPKFQEIPSSPTYPLSFPPLSPVITSTFSPLPPISPTLSSHQSLPPLLPFLSLSHNSESTNS
ncbi:hypothetical protein DICPUDRAFT_80920 [Dictyostelium purpureum]|uniref:Uncharacterized protein n=1 Tax=Dictyostelium purpureum TaxID=5786 RepID=F0ZRX9_DICPU|nr:uncharacterized protein DICPUDRAFT_80920 [Dictyostelium purpureum]EGC33308.1 hypothetical protein DICPUDRAFT_80920 [Dictyostelium purpureum]|eukprot:XP_003290164.1 hypothetical protein DICPUDRAFT_80920 [Dictyostelium purpureum]